MPTMFAQPTETLRYQSGRVSEKETKGYLNMNLKKNLLEMLSMCEWACKLPKHSVFL